MVNGTLISFEGPEGAGKSSVLEAVLPLLEEKGIPFITTREPGGVDIAEKIRQVILDPDHTRMMLRPSCCFILLVAGSIWWNVSCQPLQLGRLS